jgi:nucleotide-binding universal stress UspA family protein
VEAVSVTPVVAGVSGSPSSGQAVREAAGWAAARGLPLRLVHILGLRAGVLDQARIAGDLLRQARDVATSVAAGLWITTELVEGDAVTGFVRLSRQAALTVLGEGGPPASRAGATAARITVQARGSVMVTRSSPAPDGPVLVVVDGSTISGQLLAFSFDAAVRAGTGVAVAHIGRQPERAYVIADVIRSRALGYGIDARFEELHGDPVEMSREASLTIVGDRLPGAVTRSLLHDGRGPLLVARLARPASHRWHMPSIRLSPNHAASLSRLGRPKPRPEGASVTTGVRGGR